MRDLDLLQVANSSPSNAGTSIYHLVFDPSFNVHWHRISLLTDFENADNYLDWEVGTHGIYISFPHPSLLPNPSSEAPSPLTGNSGNLPRITSKQTFTATYLPDVMPAQGWDKVEAVDSAIQKAGWRGVISEDLRRSVKLRRYQSRRCEVSWDDYITWREEQLGDDA